MTMLHRVTLVPDAMGKGERQWQAWCYNDHCDWYTEGPYEQVWKELNKHRGVSDYA